MWRPLKDMFGDAQKKYGLPGQTKGGNRPMLELDDEWYAKIISPRDPGELEGRHNADVLVVIDEADKKPVTEEHFDSAGSSITDITGVSASRRIDWVTLPKSAFPEGDRARPPMTTYLASLLSAYLFISFAAVPMRPTVS